MRALVIHLSIKVPLNILDQQKIEALTQIVTQWVACINSTTTGLLLVTYHTTSVHLVILNFMRMAYMPLLVSMRWEIVNLMLSALKASMRKYAGRKTETHLVWAGITHVLVTLLVYLILA